MSDFYATVKELPAIVQEALASAGYGRPDIRVKVSTTVEMPGASGDGYRGFMTMVDVATGRHRTVNGSWGGSNMFTQTAVDDDRAQHPIPPTGVIITGQRGGSHPVSATLHVPASMAADMLPGADVTLSDLERDALACVVGLTSAYRKEVMRRRRITTEVLDGLVTRGLLKRNKAGAISITTAGKNAVGDYRVY